MSRCVIICAGEFGPLDFSFLPDDFIICCDAGYSHAKRLNVAPQLLMGDFDSLLEEPPSHIELLRFPVEKDDTDSMLAVREGLKRGFLEFILLFPLGGRLDHSIANLHILSFLSLHKAHGLLLGPYDSVQLLTDGNITLEKRNNYTLSVFAYGGDARGVTLKGMKYPLDKAVLTCDFPLGLGNSILEAQGSVQVSSGTLLIVQSLNRDAL